MIGHWIWLHAGLKNGVYVWYLLWSGIAGCGVIGSGVWHNSYVNTRKHNCHIRGCWRIARHPVEGTGYVVCRRHHPEGAPSHEHVLARHRVHREAVTRLAQPAGGADVLNAVKKLSDDVSGLADATRATASRKRGGAA